MDIKYYFFEKKKQKEMHKNIYKLSLKERKKIVENSLSKLEINRDEFNYLLLLDNTNEQLIYRFIQSLDKNSVYLEMQKYTSYLSVSKINDLELKFYGNSIQHYRNISNKEAFFKLLSSIKKKNKVI